jgi:DNA-binding response OmpR family regulator
MPLILVADDDADIRDLVTFKLTQAGHEVHAFDNGEDALTDAFMAVPDVAVLDVMMPKLSGIGVCSALRADGRTARVPVLLLTARAQENDLERGFAAGADDYIVKPFSPRELVMRVTAVLARASS